MRRPFLLLQANKYGTTVVYPEANEKLPDTSITEQRSRQVGASDP